MRIPGKPYYPPHLYQDDQVYFITGVIVDARHFLAAEEAKCLVRDELKASVVDYGIDLDAWVILHQHYHLLFRITVKEQLVAFIKRFHGATAIALNKLQSTPGRRVWRNYWDYCPRNDHDFYRILNYIHINPIKHGVITSSGLPVNKDKRIYEIRGDDLPDLHYLLATYEFSSYQYYARKFGLEGMGNTWLDYPIPSSWIGDDF